MPYEYKMCAKLGGKKVDEMCIKNVTALSHKKLVHKSRNRPHVINRFSLRFPQVIHRQKVHRWYSRK